MRWFVALMLAALLTGGGLAGGWWWKQRRLEKSQDEPIRAASERYAVDPALVKAIVWRESRFRPAARGTAGELGLMQLQAIAAQEWADAERIGGFQHEQCLDPRTNTLAGAFYLQKLLKRYRNTDDPVPYALADYNAGRSNVLKWLTGAGATNSAAFIEQIGYPATRDYVRVVMQRSRRYRS
ncbi:MAG: lytic transglycosylase domain-containing protein [Verrucomicrobia bacterium]|jgi:soluble lytic murein transglycosylase|nr:lytic transglycosylase domain-containing protein [Verrucomicrobiota bacterium]